MYPPITPSRGVRPPNRWRQWRGNFPFLKATVGLSNNCREPRHIGGIMGNYGELWGIMIQLWELWWNYEGLWELWRNYGELWVIMGNYGEIRRIVVELWGIMGNYGGLWENYGCHFLCCYLLFVFVVSPLASTDMSDFHPHNNVLFVLLSYLYKAPKEYMHVAKQIQESLATHQESTTTDRPGIISNP